MEKNNVIKRYPLVAFFLLTFVISWVFWLFVWIIGKGLILNTYPLFFIGAFGPCISAFAITYLLDGRAGAVRLAKRLVQWRESVKWYAVALFLIPVLALNRAKYGDGAVREFPMDAMVAAPAAADSPGDRDHYRRPAGRGAGMERICAPEAAGTVGSPGRRLDTGHHLGLLAHSAVLYTRHVPEWPPVIFWAIYTLALALLMMGL